MLMKCTTITLKREGMQPAQEAAKRQGASVSQFVREAALMRDDGRRRQPVPNAHARRATELMAIGDQRLRSDEKAPKVAEQEADRKR